jgi:predicted dehydrogenase
VRFVKTVLVESDHDVARRAAADLGWEAWATNWRDTLDDVDVVDICTPPHLHAAIALEAVARGKHVYCEKPIAMTSSEAEAMARAARDAGVTTQLGFNYRGTPAIRFIRRLIDEGRIGTPLQFRANYQQDTGFYSRSATWRGSRDTGGTGATSGIGSHIIDIALYLNGPIAAVCGLQYAQSADHTWRPDAERRHLHELDTSALWLARFENGTGGAFTCGYLSPGANNRFAFELDGTRGAVRFDWGRRDVVQFAETELPADTRGFRTIVMGDAHPDGQWRLAGMGNGYLDAAAVQFADFAQAIAAERPGAADFDHGLTVQRVVDAVTDSASTGAWQLI